MRYSALKEKINRNIFSFLDVIKTFPLEKEEAIKIQLYRFSKKDLITQIKRGLYCFDKSLIDELELASFLYQPSYVSLETALNYYGMIPDIPLAVSSITLTTTKHLNNAFGGFNYHKIKPDLFYGFSSVPTPNLGVFNLADKEKALLDYLYLRKITGLSDSRINITTLNMTKYKKYVRGFPLWVQKIKLI